MEFKGHQKSSFIDYPDKISTVLFTGGCNFRCPYCHNSELVYDKGQVIEEEYILNYLKKRRKMIDAVCISGGEATLHQGLEEFIKKAKGLGYLIKLDTNGTKPEVLKRLIEKNLLDYIAMDIKAPFNKYEKVINSNVNIESIKESIDIIMKSDIDNEYRTTVCRELLSVEDIVKIAKDIKGAKRYIIQNFRDGNSILLGEGKYTPYKREELLTMEDKIKDMFNDFKIRF